MSQIDVKSGREQDHYRNGSGGARGKDAAGISVVVPFLNEEDGICLFCAAIDEYAKELSFPLELVFVNDGSTDNSEEQLAQYSFQNIKAVRLVTLSRNFGSHAAIRAGISCASFDICTWLGSDLQEPLELLALSHEKIAAGYDAVYISKRSIGVSRSNRLFSKIYSHLMRKYAVPNYSSDGISTIVFNRKIKDLVNANIEANSSIMLQIMNAGFKTTQLDMDFRERAAGQSKWTLSKKVKLFIDSFVAFSFAPIRMVSIMGFLMALVGLIFAVITIINKLVNPSVPIGYSTMMATITIGFGITNISLGIAAEYLWRAYDAARNRPVFIISDMKDLASDQQNL